MRLNEITYTDAKPIDGYGPGFFRIGGEVMEGPLIIGPKGISSWGGYKDVEGLRVLAGEIDVLFIGTGPETTHIPTDLRTDLEENGMGVEVMSSPSACRTYNVLLSEGRRIALALIPV